ncbi:MULTISPECIES: hypothetical protein [unclassified Aliiroseovarius]|uniref:hypothetical protein n=1 Tax=unclassified Aliiroseovarius TaxID=2623558 RepID=UPI001568C9B1|nr:MULTISPECIES: hypothetical protein [unclassified Aliiroseovarius]NRP12597.1 hypothetical protein [Aliiroseovarius sp. xm-d-517]NRP42550.1 hypothetical protein [Aliiroseovarius sp. xm-m-339-2]NRP63462.1 hypothetical protein [Aliiroseovarius sp. xm-a-151]
MTETKTDQVEPNASREELEQLNGLLVRALIDKLESGSATATDIGNAVKVVVHNRVSPKEPEGYVDYSGNIPESALDFPVKI